MSLDDLYNHLKVYEAEVQKKTNSNSQDMAFISSLKNTSNKDGNAACVTTDGTAFPTGSVNVVTISQDTASAYIASQSNGSQIKFKDINQIDEDDMEEIDIKWNMALAPKSQERGRKESYRQGSKAKEKSSKALMAIDGVGWDWSYMANEEDHELIKDLKSELSKANNYIYHYKLAVAQLKGRLTEYKERKVKYIEKVRILEMYRASNLKGIKILNKELEEVKLEKEAEHPKVRKEEGKFKNLDHLIESQMSDQVKEGVGYNAVPPPAADLYLSPKKDLSWTGLPEFVDDTVTDYSRPSLTI
nr:hypothetical protein [Tanacetum cinerariifolium]